MLDCSPACCLHLRSRSGSLCRCKHGGPPVSQLLLISGNILLFHSQEYLCPSWEGKSGPSSEHRHFSWWMLTPQRLPSPCTAAEPSLSSMPSCVPMARTHTAEQQSGPKRVSRPRELAGARAAGRHASCGQPCAGALGKIEQEIHRRSQSCTDQPRSECSYERLTWSGQRGRATQSNHKSGLEGEFTGYCVTHVASLKPATSWDATSAGGGELWCYGAPPIGTGI